MPKTAAVKKAPAKRKAAKGYTFPEPIRNGEILKDMLKKEWQIGPSIGVGGFGEIYSASEVTDTTKKKTADPYVVKIEPHGNGPLFVEMHFFMKVAKSAEIESWMAKNKRKFLGMPRYLGSGSHEYNGQKYRFVVMDRFGKDLWSLFLENDREFPYPTVLRVSLQVIDVLEYIHSKTYVHGDIKGANLLLGLQKGTENKVYLVDYGLASRYAQEYKPDPKSAHNGTIEYTSRDAHMGVMTRRGDMEILGYNMLQWLASKLPWEDNLTNPVYVQQKKTEYMNNIPSLMKKCFAKSPPPAALVKYFEYVASIKHCEEPDYVLCRKILETGLKDCKCSVDGKLEFSGKEKEARTRKGTPIKQKKTSSQSDEDDMPDNEPVQKRKTRVVGTRRQKQSKTPKNVASTTSDEDDIPDTEPVQKKTTRVNGKAPKSVASTTSDEDDASSDIKDVTQTNSGTLIDRARFVFRAGEYKRLPPDQRPYVLKKQKKNDP